MQAVTIKGYLHERYISAVRHRTNITPGCNCEILQYGDVDTNKSGYAHVKFDEPNTILHQRCFWIPLSILRMKADNQ